MSGELADLDGDLAYATVDMFPTAPPFSEYHDEPTTGPAKHAAGSTYNPDTGMWTHVFRQSWLGSFSDCPEKARLDLAGELNDFTSDAAMTGTCCHEVFEVAIEDFMASGAWMDLGSCFELFDMAFDSYVESGDDRGPIVWVKRKPETARAYGRRVILAWYDLVRPQLVPLATEVSFRGLELYRDDKRIIEFNGSIDYIDAKLGLVDWKTASSPYREYQKDRWSHQATVYVWANNSATLSPAADEATGFPWEQFTFAVFPDKAVVEPQIITIQRPLDEWEPWLQRQCVGIAKLIEAELDEWPRRDAHDLCSPKWCPAWDQCKGANIVTPRWVQKP